MVVEHPSSWVDLEAALNGAKGQPSVVLSVERCPRLSLERLPRGPYWAIPYGRIDLVTFRESGIKIQLGTYTYVISGEDLKGLYDALLADSVVRVRRIPGACRVAGTPYIQSIWRERTR